MSRSRDSLPFYGDARPAWTYDENNDIIALPRSRSSDSEDTSFSLDSDDEHDSEKDTSASLPPGKSSVTATKKSKSSSSSSSKFKKKSKKPTKRKKSTKPRETTAKANKTKRPTRKRKIDYDDGDGFVVESDEEVEESEGSDNDGDEEAGSAADPDERPKPSRKRQRTSTPLIEPTLSDEEYLAATPSDKQRSRRPKTARVTHDLADEMPGDSAGQARDEDEDSPQPLLMDGNANPYDLTASPDLWNENRDWSITDTDLDIFGGYSSDEHQQVSGGGRLEIAEGHAEKEVYR